MSPTAQGPQNPPQTRGKGQVVKGKYRLAQERSGPWEEDIVGLATFEDYEEN
jgi:hypothetical protein